MSKVVEPSLPNRRDFIRLGSGALVVATLGTARTVRAKPAPSVPLHSVGYWAGMTTEARRFRTPAQAYLVAAESFHGGDPVFLHAGARAAVRGSWRPEAHRSRPASFALDVMYEAAGQPVPFHAWSLGTAGSRSLALESSHVSFDVPVDALKTADIVITRGTRKETMSFSVNSGDGTFKLRPGFYFVVLPEGEAPAEPVDWSRVRVREDATLRHVDTNGPGVLVTSNIFGAEEPVSFGYLVLEIRAGASDK